MSLLTMCRSSGKSRVPDIHCKPCREDCGSIRSRPPQQDGWEAVPPDGLERERLEDEATVQALCRV